MAPTSLGLPPYAPRRTSTSPGGLRYVSKPDEKETVTQSRSRKNRCPVENRRGESSSDKIPVEPGPTDRVLTSSPLEGSSGSGRPALTSYAGPLRSPGDGGSRYGSDDEDLRPPTRPRSGQGGSGPKEGQGGPCPTPGPYRRWRLEGEAGVAPGTVLGLPGHV